MQSGRRQEREAQRDIELMWLTGRLAPDFKTIADFRRDNGAAIRKVCREFVVLFRRLDLFSQALMAIDGSKFKAGTSRSLDSDHAGQRTEVTSIRGSSATSSKRRLSQKGDGQIATKPRPDSAART